MIDFFSKFVASFGLATVFSFTVSIVLLIILSLIVNLLRLNYYGNSYWVFPFVFYAFLFIWILSYAYFVTRAEEKSKQTNNETKIVERDKLPDDLEYVSIKANGTVESIHIGGRTEVVPVTQVKLTKYFYNDSWVLSEPELGGIIQPKGRKNYFMPVLSGSLEIKWGCAQLLETAQLEDENGIWSQFRIANITFKNEKPVSLLFRHYNYENGVWKEVAGYEAFF